jgi:glycosyltransferase 2 family protein
MAVNPSRQGSPPLKIFLQNLLRFSIVLLALAPFVYATYRQWPDVQAALSKIYWPQLFTALGLLLLFMPLMGFIPWLTLRYLGINRSLARISGLYFISQLAKYLPGGIWAYPGRIVAYETSGIDRLKAIVSVSREVTALFLGAAAFALAGVVLRLPLQTWMQVATVFGIVCSVVVVFVTQIPKVWQILSRWKFFQKSALAMLAEAQTTFSLRWLPVVLLASIIFWLGTGVGFLQLVKAVDPAAPLTWLQATSIFSLAWCVGFVIFFLPAGFGARELVLTYLLGRFISTGDALAVTLLARFWWMAVEAVYMAMSPLLVIKKRGEPLPSQEAANLGKSTPGK